MTHSEALEHAITDADRIITSESTRLAAIIVEPLMQGAAGMWPHPPAYLRALRDITTRENVLLICDEVATGFGRTGTMFASQQASISPDLMCLAKGITGGYLPLAATLTTDPIYEAFLGRPQEGKTFFHGHTYTGNPLACAAALASLDLFESDHTLKHLDSIIPSLQQKLEAEIAPLNHVADVRQQGLMVGIELAADAGNRKSYPAQNRMGAKVAIEARNRGVIVRPLGDVVVLMPPLSIQENELIKLVSVTRDAIHTTTEPR